MQISRHWRMNANRYRLQGVRYNTGEVSLQNRPVKDVQATEHNEAAETVETPKRQLTAA